MPFLSIEASAPHTATGPGAAASASAISQPWTLEASIAELAPPGAACSVTVQESLDGFVADIVTLAVLDAVAEAGSGAAAHSLTNAGRPTARIGSAGCQVRLFVQSLSAGASAQTSLAIAD